MEKYLSETIATAYLSTTPSRWAALLPRLARATQKLQREETQLASSTAHDVQDCLRAAEALIHEDHCTYEKGARLYEAFAETHPTLAHSLDAILRDMLVELCTREAILAHWSAAPTGLTSDQLRTYSHALLVRKVHARDVQRLRVMIDSASK